MTNPDRAALHAYLSPDGHAIIQDLADDNGVSMTGLLEGLSSMIGDDMFEDALYREWITLARKVDAQRRRRRAS